MSEAFEIGRALGVARVTINRPAVSNALRPDDFRALADILVALDGDASVSVIVLTGAGRSFCAGLDLKDTGGPAADIDGAAGPTGLGVVLRRGLQMSKPLIGRVNGACVGGGMGLLALCDIAVSNTGARFGFPEIRSGLYPFVATAIWEGRVPAAELNYLALRGDLIDAERAQRIGFVQDVLPADELDDSIGALCASLIQMGGRAQMRKTRGEDVAARIERAEQQFRRHRRSM